MRTAAHFRPGASASAPGKGDLRPPRQGMPVFDRMNCKISGIPVILDPVTGWIEPPPGLRGRGGDNRSRSGCGNGE